MENIKDLNNNNMKNTNTNKNGVFSDWNQKELAALQRALQKIKHSGERKPPPPVKPSIKGCYYNINHQRYIVNFYDGIKLVYAGCMLEWDENLAKKMIENKKLQYNK